MPVASPAQQSAEPALAGQPALAGSPILVRGPAATGPDSPAARSVVTVDRRALGRSGALRVAIVETLAELSFLVMGPGAAEPLAYRWVPLMGTRREALAGEISFAQGLYAPSQPGLWRLSLRGSGWTQDVTDLVVITRTPFEKKQGGYLNGYHIGRYPTEGSGRTDEYAPPAGFIEVTPANQDLQISEHFRISQFITKDQFDVWPKYVALDLRLIDKLEMVLQELNAMGIRAERMHVMSGYRTPQYNGPGGDGRARLSRHTYGDAADVWVDNDGDRWIDDLNGDGRRDIEDVKVMARAVDRVEQQYPELLGGAGLYLDNSAHGPFIHIDVRGERTRW